MRYSIRSLGLAAVLIGAIVSFKNRPDFIWIWGLMIFASMAVLLASIEIDNCDSRSTIWVNWFIMVATVCAAVGWYVYR